MSNLRKCLVALSLASVLFGSTAFAASGRDDRSPGDFISRAKTLLVKMLEDIRQTLPPG